MARKTPPNLVVLDLGLPKMDGLDARALRQHPTSIMLLTARVEGAEAGCRPRAGRRRLHDQAVQPARAGGAGPCGASRAPTTAAHGGRCAPADLTLDVPRRRPSRGRPVDLTRPSSSCWPTLVAQPGRVFTRAQLLDAIRGDEVDAFERAIDAHVKNIRRKIEPDPRAPRYLLTVYGVGYQFATHDAAMPPRPRSALVAERRGLAAATIRAGAGAGRRARLRSGGSSAIAGLLCVARADGRLGGPSRASRGGSRAAVRAGVAALLFVARCSSRLLRRSASPLGDLVRPPTASPAATSRVRVRSTGRRAVRTLAHAFNAMAAGSRSRIGSGAT